MLTALKWSGRLLGGTRKVIADAAVMIVRLEFFYHHRIRPLRHQRKV